MGPPPAAGVAVIRKVIDGSTGLWLPAEGCSCIRRVVTILPAPEGMQDVRQCGASLCWLPRRHQMDLCCWHVSDGRAISPQSGGTQWSRPSTVAATPAHPGSLQQFRRVGTGLEGMGLHHVASGNWQTCCRHVNISDAVRLGPSPPPPPSPDSLLKACVRGLWSIGEAQCSGLVGDGE